MERNCSPRWLTTDGPQQRSLTGAPRTSRHRPGARRRPTPAHSAAWYRMAAPCQCSCGRSQAALMPPPFHMGQCITPRPTTLRRSSMSTRKKRPEAFTVQVRRVQAKLRLVDGRPDHAAWLKFGTVRACLRIGKLSQHPPRHFTHFPANSGPIFPIFSCGLLKELRYLILWTAIQPKRNPGSAGACMTGQILHFPQPSFRSFWVPI